MTMPSLDPRRHPMRPDLAAEYLRGQVTAERFVAGREMRIAEPVVDLRSRPSPDAGVETQALFGEIFIAYEDQEGWVWGQLKRDGYVGYMSANGLVVGESVATHKLTVPRSFVYPGLSMKLPIVCALSLGSELKVTKQHGDFVEVEHLGCLWAAHVAPLDQAASDFVSIAEMFLHVPYLWGGKSALGLDCSGLIQISLQAAGIAAPRDTDMQWAELGQEIALGDDLAGLKRGDLIFWNGHVGVMRDAHNLLHANGHHMMVVSEPLRQARDRISAKSHGPIIGVKRL